MSDQEATDGFEPTRLSSVLMLLGSFLFSGRSIPEIDSDALEELRDLIDMELAGRKGMIH